MCNSIVFTIFAKNTTNPDKTSKMPMRKTLTIISLLLSISVFAQFPKYTVKTVPSPKDFAGGSASPTEARNGYVSNPDGLLHPMAVPVINGMLDTLEINTGVQMAVVALYSIGDVPASQFAVDLFNYWGIGDAKKNTGLLLLWVPGQRYVQITTGTGMEKYLTDYDCGEILDDYLIPQFKDTCYAAGVIAAVGEIQHRLMQPEVRAELLRDYEKKEEPGWVKYLCWYITAMMLVLILLCILSVRNVVRRDGEDNDKAVARVKTLVGVMSFLTVLFPFLYFLRRWTKGRQMAIRKQPFKCDKCSHEMRLLSEDEEDKFLSANQQAEERVQSIDHDVWLCPECGNTKIYSYRINDDYTQCSACGAVTMSMTSDHVITHATEYSTGKGCKTYTCANCGKVSHSYYVIPRITPRDSDSGGSSSGGGGGSSSWGGGHSSGGGAGRSY